MNSEARFRPLRIQIGEVGGPADPIISTDSERAQFQRFDALQFG
jgi:hypothetical protein